MHEEFKQNVENIGTEMLLRRFAESKGTGRERPGELAVPPHLHKSDAPPSLVHGRSRGARLIPLLVAGVLDFDEYRLAPAQEGKYVCIQQPPRLGLWGC